MYRGFAGLMKKSIFYLLLIGVLLPLHLSAVEFTQAQQDYISHTASLTFSEVDWGPLSCTADPGEYKGIIADYLQILSTVTGIHFEYVESSTWQEVLEKFSRGEIDLVPALAVGDVVGSDVLLTDPYTSFPLVIATRPDIDFIGSTRELRGKLVGVGRGYTSQNFLQKNYPYITLVAADNVTEGLKMLEKGEIDAFVGHMAVVLDSIKKNRLDLRIAGKTEFVFEHRIGLPPGHEQTIDIFNRVFSEISPEEHNRIYNRWIKMNTDIRDYSLVWKILFIAVLIISVTVYWNRKLSADKKRYQELVNRLNALKDELEIKNRELKTLAVTDQLTGLYNRLKLDQALEDELGRYARSGKPFGVIMADIDHFKMINDSFGHPAGDEVLIAVSGLLRSSIRSTDVIGRWGGEEFLIICPETDHTGLEVLTEKLRSKIEKYNFCIDCHCTASFGATVSIMGECVNSTVKRSDEALYRAKNSGRNKTVVI
jgi:polar amino acid transport system substrate-binding protein